MEKKPTTPPAEAPPVPAGKLDPIERKLVGMLVRLPLLPQPLGSYVPLVRTGKLVFISGQLPLSDNSLGAYKGRLGREVSIEAAIRGAKQCTLNALAWFKQEFGGLDKLKRVVKVTGFVAGMPGFTEQSRVVNGASDFLVELYGDAGKHARVAVGVTDLPLGACVEIEYLFESK